MPTVSVSHAALMAHPFARGTPLPSGHRGTVVEGGGDSPRHLPSARLLEQIVMHQVKCVVEETEPSACPASPPWL